ncbi:hypothetical protein ABPG75_012627 [Micractinium tetrahymenae]
MEASRAYQETVDTDTFHPRDAATDRAQEAQPGQVLPLPAPEDAPGGRGGAAQLGVGEGPLQMDHLGPLVIGDDGSVSRIANWHKLTEREQTVALHRLTARNRERLARLRGENSQAAVVPAATAAQVQQEQKQAA